VNRGKASGSLLSASRTQCHAHGTFDGGAAHLAVPLRGVRIADREQGAGHFDGQEYSSVPWAKSRTSMLPPTRRGGTTLCRPGSAGATPMVPVKGLSGTCPSDHTMPAQGRRVVAPKCSAGSLNSSASRPNPGNIRGPSPARGYERQESVTFRTSPGSAPSMYTGTRHRIDLGEIETRNIGGRRGAQLATGRRPCTSNSSESPGAMRTTGANELIPA
jgi:hypothetical protein